MGFVGWFVRLCRFAEEYCKQRKFVACYAMKLKTLNSKTGMILPPSRGGGIAYDNEELHQLSPLVLTDSLEWLELYIDGGQQSRN